MKQKISQTTFVLFFLLFLSGLSQADNKSAVARSLFFLHGTDNQATQAGNDDQFVARDVIIDKDGSEHVRFDRTYKGLPVIGGDQVTHANSKGDFSEPSSTLAKSALQSPGKMQPIFTNPTLTKASAIALAENSFLDPLSEPSTARLVVYARHEEPVLGWDVLISGPKTDGLSSRLHLIIEDRSALVIDRWSELQTAAVASTSAIGFYAGSIALTTDSILNSSGVITSYQLLDPTRASQWTGSVTDGDAYRQTLNSWGSNSSTDPVAYAVDAQYGANITWDYFKKIHGWTSSNIFCPKVHMNANSVNWAYWDTSFSCAFFSDGDPSTTTSTWPGFPTTGWVALDIVAHEITHGVTQQTANLIYSGESGGLNEASSDIFGAMVENYASSSNTSANYKVGNYLFGEKITPNPATTALRYMYQPSLDGLSADCWTKYITSTTNLFGTLDVHYSSGVANHFFYLLAQGTPNTKTGIVSPTCALGTTSTFANQTTTLLGVGEAIAEKIWFRALTACMVSNSDYSHARYCTNWATNDLYPADSTLALNVNNAWDAVNVAAQNTTKTAQTITSFTVPFPLTIGASGTLSGIASSGLDVFFRTNTPSICSVNKNQVTQLSTGACVLLANQPGNNTYSAAAPLTKIVQTAQTISNLPANATLKVSKAATLNATASSALPITYTTSTPTICSVSAPPVTATPTVTAITTGTGTTATCTVTASQSGDADYAPATDLTQTITVSMGTTAQTIVFPKAVVSPTLFYATNSVTLNATASSGLPITYTTSTPTICSLSQSEVTPIVVTAIAIAPGTCIVTASQVGSDLYTKAISVSQSIVVTAGTTTAQSISGFPATGTLKVFQTTKFDAKASSGLSVTYSTSTPTICTVSGNQVTAIAFGTCKVLANQAGNATWKPAATLTDTIIVSAGTTLQTITVNKLLPLGVNEKQTLAASSTDKTSLKVTGLPITYGTSTSTICTVSGNVVTAKASGTCTVTANQAGGVTYDSVTGAVLASYAAATQSVSIAVAKHNQTVTFPIPTIVSAKGTLTATVDSGLVVTVTSATTGICTVSGATVSVLAYGTCTLNANQSGNTIYNAATQKQISFIAMPLAPVAPGSLTVTVPSTTTMKLTWIDKANNEQGYRVYRTSGTTTVLLTTLSAATGTTMAYTDSPPVTTKGTSYTYKVEVFNPLLASASLSKSF